MESNCKGHTDIWRMGVGLFEYYVETCEWFVQEFCSTL
jgi:hypothetical protein